MRLFWIVLLSSAGLCGRAVAGEPGLSPGPLEGRWFRVYEKCRSPLDPVPDFAANGGDAFIGRRMMLVIDGGRFSATSFHSLRCGRMDVPKLQPDDSSTIDCKPQRENRGDASWNDDTLRLIAKESPLDDNGWGTTWVDWQYRFIGPVLELSNADYSGDCKLERFYTYWIRSPDS